MVRWWSKFSCLRMLSKTARCDTSTIVVTYALSDVVAISQIADSDMLAAHQHWCSWTTHGPGTVRLKSNSAERKGSGNSTQEEIPATHSRRTNWNTASHRDWNTASHRAHLVKQILTSASSHVDSRPGATRCASLSNLLSTLVGGGCRNVAPLVRGGGG